MTKEQIIDFINKNPMFALATVDGDRPRVRNMMTAFADERGIIFTTGKNKYIGSQQTPQHPHSHYPPKNTICIHAIPPVDAVYRER